MSVNKQKSQRPDKLTRRQFIRNASAAAVAASVAIGPARRVLGKVPSANDRLGIGFIGNGSRGCHQIRLVHYLKTQGAKEDIVATCDVYRPRMQAVVNGYGAGAKGYMDYRELLADPNVDVVFIATPDHHHGQMAIDALKAGKHIYCEKPITHWSQLKLMKQLAEMVEKTDLAVQCGTDCMADLAWRKMGQMVRKGIIGKPVQAECGYFRVGDHAERGMGIDDHNAKPGPDLDWEAFLGDRPKRPFDVSRFFRWRMYMDYAGGITTDLLPHALTPSVHITGGKLPSKVVATGGKYRYNGEREVPDTCNLLIEYPEKLTIACLGTQANGFSKLRNPPIEGGRLPVIRGFEGALTIENRQIAFYPVGVREPKLFEIKDEQVKSVELHKLLIQHWDNLIDAIRTGKRDKIFSPMDLGYHVNTALQMGMYSLIKDKAIKFDAEKKEIIL